MSSCGGAPSLPGVTNGYVGIGFDEYGNFSNCQYGYGGPVNGTTVPQSVVIRGSGAGGTSSADRYDYAYLSGVQLSGAPFSTTVDGVPRASARHVKISVVNQVITVLMDFGAGYQTVVNGFNLAGAAHQVALPATFKMGFSASTGAANNYHELRNLVVAQPANLSIAQTVSPATVAVGGTVTYTVTVTNDATNVVDGATFADAIPAGLTGVTWTATASGGATLGATSGAGNAVSTTANFPRGSSVTFTITGTASAAAGGAVLTNTATITPPSSITDLVSNTATTPVTVSQMSTQTALAVSPAAAVWGQPVTLTATVTAPAPGSGTPSGTITFEDGGTAIGTGALSSGVATLTTASLAVGTHALTAVYGGAAAYAGSASPAPSTTVAQAASAATASSGLDPSLVGEGVTFTATVTAAAPGAGTPTGTVTFLDGAVGIGTATLSGGVATFTTTGLAAGSHAISVSYPGDANFTSSGSAPLSQTVSQGSAAVAVTSSLSPSTYGTAVTYTARVSAVAPAAGTPTGTVTFTDGGTTLGTATLSGGAAAITSALAPAGVTTVTATYGGDLSFGAAVGTVSQAVNRAAAAVALALSPAAPVTGQAVTLTATVTGAGSTPTGAVTFTDGGTTLGTGTLDGSGKATLTTSALAVGAHALAAAYGGDADHAAASGSAALTVGKAATSLALAAAPVLGQAVTLTATLTVTAPGAGTPSGAVTFYDGGSPIGTGAISGGKATLATSTLAAGSHALTASYGGDGSFTGSASAPLPLAVGGGATTAALAVSPSPATVGQAVTLVVTVTSGGGTPPGTVLLSDGGAPLGAVTLDAAGHGTLTVSGLAAGAHALAAVYAGSGSFLQSRPAVVTLEVNPASSTTAVASSANPTTTHLEVVFTATVTTPASGAGTPTGTVTFTDGTGALGAASLDATGTATLAVRSLARGPHPITAAYGGDAGHAASSGALAETVEDAPPVAGSGSALAFGAAGPTATVAGSGAALAGIATAELWFAPDWSDPAQVSGAGCLAGLGAGATARFLACVTPARDALQITLGAAAESVAVAGGLATGAWHHLALVGLPSETLVYLDEALVATLPEPLGAGAAGMALTLGARPTAAGVDQRLVGRIDEVRLWTSIRSQAELAATAEAPLAGTEPGLAGLWRLDEGAGTFLYDASPGQSDGRLDAAPAGTWVPSDAWRWRATRVGLPVPAFLAAYDPDGDPVTLSVTAPPAGGVVTATGATLSYLPTGGFRGDDAFTYRASDGTLHDDFTVDVGVASGGSCQLAADCGGGESCVAGLCTSAHALQEVSGGCATGGAAVGIPWALALLGLARRRRRAAPAGGAR